jgi:hypothetical protein
MFLSFVFAGGFFDMKSSQVFREKGMFQQESPSQLDEGIEENPTVAMGEATSNEAALLPRVVRGCEFLQYLFPKRVREEVFLPSYQDMYTLNLIGRQELGGPFAARWMDFVLIVRSLDIVARCVLIWTWDYLRFLIGK